jgi:hypothetical protein
MKKKVDVFCAQAFVIGHANFAGKCLGIILDVDTIRLCLINKAFVWELTPDGKRIPLDFSNYRLDNGGVVDDTYITSDDPRMKKSNVIKAELGQNEDGSLKVVKEEKVVVQKKEVRPKVFEAKTKEEKKEPVVEKKQEVVTADLDVTAKIEDTTKEENKTPDTSFNKFEKHNKNKK